MIWRRIQVKAHLFSTLAGAWLLLSAFALFDWLDAHRRPGDVNAFPALVVWSLQLLLGSAAYHFRRSERVREVLWIGEDTHTAEALFELERLPAFLRRVVALVDSGFSEADVALVREMAEEATPDGGSGRQFAIMYRGRRSTLGIVLCPCANEPALVNVSLTTHPDLAGEIKQVIADSFESSGRQ